MEATLYPGKWAALNPDKPAVIMAEDHEAVTYRELDERSMQLAQLWHAGGLRPGDHIAVFAQNHIRFMEIYWAAIRSGLYFTSINKYLTADEAGYILNDSGAKALVTTAELAEVATQLPPQAPRCHINLMIDGVAPGFESYETAIAASPARPLEQEPRGDYMLYSSGTTGRPKGVKRPLSGLQITDDVPWLTPLLNWLGYNPDVIGYSPAPMYHAAPLGFCAGTHMFGGTAVISRKFDAEAALDHIERYRITHSQWVPTMFVRMLKLPEAAREGRDLTSHRVAIHSAAPCPAEVKKAMMSWWGPVLYEYYGGTEMNGLTVVGPEDWLAHPGTVGSAFSGVLHICDDAGAELPAGAIGNVYFELPQRSFGYHNDGAKTDSAFHPDHPTWSTLGDVGYLDADGFLYLTDRASFMIISGGVNIYPQEIEDALITHPKVQDVAVFGVPNSDLGEEVKAVVQPAAGVEPGPDLEAELVAYAREKLAHYKAPRSIDFQAELPRLDTGKLYKRVLRETYWVGHKTRVA